MTHGRDALTFTPPKGMALCIRAERAPRPVFHEAELLEAGRIKERLDRTPLGDGCKIAVKNTSLVSGDNIALFHIEAGPMMYSQLLGVFEAGAGLGHMELHSQLYRRWIRVLLSNNLLTLADGSILLSQKDPRDPLSLRTPLNGFADWGDLGMDFDHTFMARIAIRELMEEYAIEAPLSAYEAHSISADGSHNLPGAIVVIGSVSLPLSFAEVEDRRSFARDRYENPGLVRIAGTLEAIEEAVSDVPSLGPALLAYAERVL